MTPEQITAFVTLFVIIDPIGLAPIFVALTTGIPAPQRRKIALRAVLLAFALLALFGFFGQALLNAVGIGMPAFRISGGILLFLIAVEMLFERRRARREKQAEEAEAEEAHSDPSVFPLALPLLAGPGALATVILLMERNAGDLPAQLSLLGVAAIVLGIAYILFMSASLIERVLGQTGVNVVTRLLGVLLAALSVQFVVDGLRDLGVLAG
ncbi:MAG: MarC family protein [Pseudomonadota bacterium]